MYEVKLKLKNKTTQVVQCNKKSEAVIAAVDMQSACEKKGTKYKLSTKTVSEETMQMRASAKPILFKPDLVEKIRDNIKTVTRRLVKQPAIRNKETGKFEVFDDGNFQMRVDGYTSTYDYVVKTKYAEGDVLYVQEAFQIISIVDDEDYPELHLMFRDGSIQNVIFTPERFEKFKKFYGKNGWQSPYFMPKEAARFYLKITNVKVERLQEINTGDYRTPINIKQEGLYEPCLRCPYSNGECKDFIARDSCLLVRAWVKLWNGTLTPKQKAAGLNYESNPLVAVYTFSVI